MPTMEGEQRTCPHCEGVGLLHDTRRSQPGEWRKCPVCGGTGKVQILWDNGRQLTCDECLGKGRIVHRGHGLGQMPHPPWELCEDCGGWERECPKCKGRGVVTEGPSASVAAGAPKVGDPRDTGELEREEAVGATGREPKELSEGEEGAVAEGQGRDPQGGHPVGEKLENLAKAIRAKEDPGERPPNQVPAPGNPRTRILGTERERANQRAMWEAKALRAVEQFQKRWDELTPWRWTVYSIVAWRRWRKTRDTGWLVLSWVLALAADQRFRELRKERPSTDDILRQPGGMFRGDGDTAGSSRLRFRPSPRSRPARRGMTGSSPR